MVGNMHASRTECLICLVCYTDFVFESLCRLKQGDIASDDSLVEENNKLSADIMQAARTRQGWGMNSESLNWNIGYVWI